MIMRHPFVLCTHSLTHSSPKYFYSVASVLLRRVGIVFVMLREFQDMDIDSILERKSRVLVEEPTAKVSIDAQYSSSGPSVTLSCPLQ